MILIIILYNHFVKMADGKTHDLLTVSTLPLAIFCGVMSAQAGHDIALLAIPLGHASGLIINPDLDLRTRTRAERHLHRLALLTWPLIVMSNLYARLFNTGRWPFVHRGISHWPIIGTMTRWMLFASPILVLALISGNETALAILPALCWAFIGNCLSDCVHSLADFVHSLR